ncbi:serine O-acetyltransferase [Desertivibrio insolitus]|uniref:serine O-acetyltransferase n=1 Tax=Herbiconiux sp. SYSU D00978 TaxID=2812562 RepID=UPI001F60D295|nr:DapH/DapD/GlmU-related protein [Herbiconiux sp. SYSU D00978]
MSPRDQLNFAIAADFAAIGAGRWRWRYRYTKPVLRYQRERRRAEHWLGQKGTLGRLYGRFLRLRCYRLGLHLGLEIPLGVAGPGFNIAHAPGIVINPDVRIGKNCRIHQNVTIGQGRNGSPVLGDNVWLGAGAVVVGGIQVGDNVAIGANAVVTKDVPPHTTVAGNPARVISQEGSGPWIHDGVGVVLESRRRLS